MKGGGRVKDKIDILKSASLVDELVFRAMKQLQDEKKAQLMYCQDMKLPTDSIADEVKELDRKIRLCSVLLKEI